jgi:hypothetical protein
MRIFFFVLFITFNYLSFSQNTFLGVFRASNSETAHNSLRNLLNKTIASLQKCENKSCKAQVYHAIGSIYYFLDNNSDSVEYYLEKSYCEDSIWLCEKSQKLDSLYKDTSRGLYYASSFSKKWWSNHQIRCNKICGSCDKKTNIMLEIDSSKNITYQSALIEIWKNDQYFRLLDKISEQMQLDSINRYKLDSLYNIFGFPKKNLVSIFCQEKAWFILQHSTDCEWTKKWIDRFLTAYLNNDSEGFFLSQTINRFFAPNSGYCKDDRKKFIHFLKTKYPSNYGQIFGYDKFD